MSSLPVVTKRCSKCKRFRSLDLFNKDRSHKDGLTTQCKDCILEKHWGKIVPKTLNGLKQRIKPPPSYKWCGGFSPNSDASAAHLERFENFALARNRKDGYNQLCKDCSKKKYQAKKISVNEND